MEINSLNSISTSACRASGKAKLTAATPPPPPPPVSHPHSHHWFRELRWCLIDASTALSRSLCFCFHAHNKPISSLNYGEQASAQEEEMVPPTGFLPTGLLFSCCTSDLHLHLHLAVSPPTHQGAEPCFCGIEAGVGFCELRQFCAQNCLLDFWVEGGWFELEEDAEGSVPSMEPVRCAFGPQGLARGEIGVVEFCEERICFFQVG